MKVSAKDIPVIKRNLHLTDEQLGQIFRISGSGMKQARHRFKIFRPLARFKKGVQWDTMFKPGHKIGARFKPGHPYYPFKKFVPAGRKPRKKRALVIEGFFEFEPKHRKDQDYWLKLII